MANRFLARPEKYPGQQFSNPPNYPLIKVGAFTSGLNTEDDPDDIPDDAFTVDANGMIRRQRVTKVPGVTRIGPTKPNSNPVRGLISIQQYSGELVQLRFTASTIYRRAASAWAEITSTGPGINEAPNNSLSVDNRHFFSTNGNRVIQEIDLSTDTYSNLGNSKRYRYITAFGDRLVGFYDEDNGPVDVGWSGNLNYAEWNPLVDPSAGMVPLVESQSDYADFGTGIFGFADKLLLLKERSIWLASKTGVGTNPFYFYVTSPSFGCDTPSSVQRIPNGIVYYDRRTSNVYVFDVNNPTPIPIGSKVSDEILALVDNPDEIFSSFDSVELEYRLAIPRNEGNGVDIFAYSFKSQAWWMELRTDISCISSLNFAEPTTLIQDLVGNIEDLTGTIAGLGTAGYPTPTVFYGLTSGDIDVVDDGEPGNNHSMELVSKTWTAPENNDFFIHRLTFTYEALSEGSFVISYSKDNSMTFTVYKTVTVSAGDVGKRLIANCVNSVRARQYSWKILNQLGRIALVDFKARTEPSGYSRL